jgi:hypothetical protein
MVGKANTHPLGSTDCRARRPPVRADHPAAADGARAQSSGGGQARAHGTVTPRAPGRVRGRSPAPLTKHALYLAAVLTCGQGAVVSHTSAAQLWRLPCRRESRVHVTVPGRGGRVARQRIVVHRAGLERSEVASVDGIPVTSPGRTLVDLADSHPRRALERALDEAAYLGLDLSGLQPRHGRRGARVLGSVLREHRPGTTLTRSRLEEKFSRCGRRSFSRCARAKACNRHV